MKTDKNGCSTCEPGKENFETFERKGIKYFQYEYRSPFSGALFTCIVTSLTTARFERDTFMKEEEKQDIEAERLFLRNHPELNP